MGEVNEKVDTEVPVDCPNTIGVLAVVDAPKEKKGDGDGELADEPNAFAGETAEKGELVVLSEVVPEPNGFAGEIDEAVTDTLVVNDVPDVPNIVDEPDEPNWKGTLCVTAGAPLLGGNCVLTADEEDEAANEELNPKGLFPAFVVANMLPEGGLSELLISVPSLDFISVVSAPVTVETVVAGLDLGFDGSKLKTGDATGSEENKGGDAAGAVVNEGGFTANIDGLLMLVLPDVMAELVREWVVVELFPRTCSVELLEGGLGGDISLEGFESASPLFNVSEGTQLGTNALAVEASTAAGVELSEGQLTCPNFSGLLALTLSDSLVLS